MPILKKKKFNIFCALAKKNGTALLMTILILNSIILISLAAAKVIVSGVKNSGVQSRSTKAYFAAEAGAERMLYEYRKGVNFCGQNGHATSTCAFSAVLSGGGSYQVNWTRGTNDLGSTLVFISMGSYAGLRRSDELDFSY
jgi:hypothetical protein